MVDNQTKNLQWKIFLCSTSRANQIFRGIEEGLGCFLSQDYHAGSMVFCRESFVLKCYGIGSSKASNSFIYKTLSLSLSFLFILFKHGRHPEQTFNRNLGSSHRDENTFDSRTYSLSEQSNSRLGFPKLPGQHRIETLANCFQTNLQSFRKTIIGPICFRTLQSTATIHSLTTRPSKCKSRCISTGLEIRKSV